MFNDTIQHSCASVSTSRAQHSTFNIALRASHHIKRIFSKEKEDLPSVMNETNTNNEKVLDNPLGQYERKDKKSLDFTNEYDRYIRWKKKR